jgi:hypothetical protein
MHKLAAEQCCKVDGSSTCLPEDHQDAREYIVSRNDGFDLLSYWIMLFPGRVLAKKEASWHQNGALQSEFNSDSLWFCGRAQLVGFRKDEKNCYL